MVYIVYERLLSSSNNRLLYESLWNLAINKSLKLNSKFTCEELSISQICNQLINEINRDESDRNKFYFSTQLCFGAVLLYRSQIDKLYGQAKMALQTCTVTLYEINWLSDIGQEPSQFLASSKTGKKGGPTKDKNPQQKRNIDDFDLIEQAFTIPADTPASKNSRTQKLTDDNLDPTMAISTEHITMIENRTHNVPMPMNNNQDDDFGSLGPQDFDLSFHLPEAAKDIVPTIVNDVIADQQVPQYEEVLDENIRMNMVASKDLEHTLADDVKEIVNKQVSLRKRRGTNDIDICNRLDSSKKQRLEPLEDTNNNIETSQFDLNANEPEVNSSTDKSLKLINSTFVGAREETSFIPALSLLASSELSPIQLVKKNKKKQNLIIDKQIRIKDDILKKEMENYKLKLTVPSPLDTFVSHMQTIKDSTEMFFLAPASRMNKFSNKLMPAFQRNLKRISSKSLKRPCEVDGAEASEQSKPPYKRQSLMKIHQISLIADHTVPEVTLHSISEIAAIVQSDGDMIIPTQSFVEPELSNLEDLGRILKSSKGRTNYETSNEIGNYREGDKWSKQDIMNSLTAFWSKKQETITMTKLCRQNSKANRFVAAGIFFEIMELSKTGAIELFQEAGLEISNILPGPNANQYA